MGELILGTSSWSEKTWVGSFYPAGTKPGDMLALYAGTYRAVEADVTYYRIPSERMVRTWAQVTPPGFTLCAKFPRSIVHAGQGKEPDPAVLLVPGKVGADVERFLAAMTLLGGKCGPLVLQLPYFNRKVFAGPEKFLDRLDRFLGGLPREFRYAVEIRNRAWLASPLLDLLRSHGAALVLVDMTYMPHPADIEEPDLVTADFTYGRLIGDRKAVESVTDRFDRVVVDQGPRLQRWAALLARLVPRVERAYVFANNHYAGHAPATCRRLRQCLAG
jgi:uncharacterized protein YecE (DUF72 family)